MNVDEEPVPPPAAGTANVTSIGDADGFSRPRTPPPIVPANCVSKGNIGCTFGNAGGALGGPGGTDVEMGVPPSDAKKVTALAPGFCKTTLFPVISAGPPNVTSIS